MVELKIDENEVKKLLKDEIEKHLQEIDNEPVFWDTPTLCKMVNMSFNFIKDQFFYHPDFPKHKVGGKWYYPVKQTKQFLLNWIEQQ